MENGLWNEASTTLFYVITDYPDSINKNIIPTVPFYYLLFKIILFYHVQTNTMVQKTNHFEI